MDPDAPQGDVPVIPTEAPVEDADAIAPPSEPAPTADVPPIISDDRAPALSPNLEVAENTDNNATVVSSVPASTNSQNIDITNNSSEPQPAISQQATVPPLTVAPSPVPAAPVPNPAAAPTGQPAPFDPHSKDELNFLRTVLAPRAWASHRARTQAKLDKIMALARQKGQIDRSDVRDLLNRSKPACTRYLTTLVKRGLLTRHRVLDDTVYRVS